MPGSRSCDALKSWRKGLLGPGTVAADQVANVTPPRSHAGVIHSLVPGDSFVLIFKLPVRS